MSQNCTVERDHIYYLIQSFHSYCSWNSFFPYEILYSISLSLHHSCLMQCLSRLEEGENSSSSFFNVPSFILKDFLCFPFYLGGAFHTSSHWSHSLKSGWRCPSNNSVGNFQIGRVFLISNVISNSHHPPSPSLDQSFPRSQRLLFYLIRYFQRKASNLIYKVKKFLTQAIFIIFKQCRMMSAQNCIYIVIFFLK